MFGEINTALKRDTVHLRGCLRLVGVFVGACIAAYWVPPGYAIGAALVALVGLALFDKRARTKQIQQFAERSGFLYLGSALPGFSLKAASWSRDAHSVTRVVWGEKAQQEFVVFDCRLGHGKRTTSRTVVAVRGQLGNLGAAQFGPDRVEQVGEWAVLLSSDYVLPVSEIEEILSDLR